MNLELKAVAIAHCGDHAFSVHHLDLRGELQIAGLHRCVTGNHKTADL